MMTMVLYETTIWTQVKMKHWDFLFKTWKPKEKKKPQNPTTDNFILMSENTRDHYVQYCMPIWGMGTCTYSCFQVHLY